MAISEINVSAAAKKSAITQNINKGLAAGIISINSDESKITYNRFRDYTTSFNNPDEKVRASYFSELVLTYKYPVNRINIEVLVPKLTPEYRADNMR